MAKPSRIVITIIIIILLLLVWFVSSETKKKGTAAPITIGVIAPLTGDFADYGENVKNGVEAGVPQERCGAGERCPSGNKTRFVFEDEKCEAKEAVAAFRKLTDIDQIHFIIGPGCGSPQEAVVPLLDQAKVVAIVPSAASSDLFTASGGNFFNIQYSLQDESKFIAEQMNAAGYKNVALVTYGNAFSKAHADSFRANFKGTIAADTVLKDDNANLLPELTKIKAAHVDAIYAPDISFFFAGATAKLKQLGMKMPVYTTYVAELPAAIPLVEGVIYSFPADLGTSTAEHGAVYELSKQAAETLIPLVESCAGEPLCVKTKLSSSGKFDSNGVYKRELILKKVVKGVPTILEMNQNN